MVRLFRVFVPTSVVTLLLSEIVLIFSCYILACFFTLDSDPGVFLLYEGGLARITLVVSCVMLGIYFHDLYEHVRIKSRTLLFQQMLDAGDHVGIFVTMRQERVVFLALVEGVCVLPKNFRSALPKRLTHLRFPKSRNRLRLGYE